MPSSKKVKTFREKLVEVNKDLKNVQALREEADKKIKEASEKEKEAFKKQFEILSTELKLNKIDPNDLQFILDACKFYKKYLEENKPSFMNADKDVSVKNVSDANG